MNFKFQFTKNLCSNKIQLMRNTPWFFWLKMSLKLNKLLNFLKLHKSYWSANGWYAQSCPFVASHAKEFLDAVWRFELSFLYFIRLICFKMGQIFGLILYKLHILLNLSKRVFWFHEFIIFYKLFFLYVYFCFIV